MPRNTFPQGFPTTSLPPTSHSSAAPAYCAQFPQGQHQPRGLTQSTASTGLQYSRHHSPHPPPQSTSRAHHNPSSSTMKAPANTTQPTLPSRSLSSDRRHTERLKDESPKEETSKENGQVGELKPSRSVGNLISELQRESEALAQARTSRPSSRGATGLENWVPWPQLEGDKEAQDEACLADLMDDEANSCRQLCEMGFPLSR